MGGLTVTNPVLGWGLVLGVVAIAGLPPLGIFMSEFLVVSSTFAREPWLAIVLVVRHPGRRRRAVPAVEHHRFRRAARHDAPKPRPPTCRCSRISRSSSSPASICRRRWSPGSRTSRSFGIEPMSALTDMIAGEPVAGHGGGRVSW